MNFDCCEKNSKNKKRNKIIAIFLIVFLIIFGIILYFNLYVNPIILQSNQAVIKSATTGVINDCISSSIEQEDFDNLINILYDNDGNITAITANSFIANKLNNQIINDCQIALNDMNKLNFSVPLGSFSGITIFNGLGPKITIKMVPVGNIETKFVSEFVGQGINQTNHKIFLDITTNVSVLLPGKDKTIKVNTSILISDSVIIGKVPQVYFGANNSLNEQLNLIP